MRSPAGMVGMAMREKDMRHRSGKPIECRVQPIETQARPGVEEQVPSLSLDGKGTAVEGMRGLEPMHSAGDEMNASAEVHASHPEGGAHVA
jgi:hypothetical protein